MGLLRRIWSIQGTWAFIVPGGVTTMVWKGLGNGGAGGTITSSTGHAGGGTGGNYSQATISVTPGEELTIVIPDFTLSGDGGDVEVWRGGVGGTCLLRAKGGKEGNSASGGGSGGVKAADNTGSIGDLFFLGGDGGAGGVSPSNASGGGGGGAWEQDGGDASGGTAGSPLDNGPNGQRRGGPGGPGTLANGGGLGAGAFGGGGGGANRSTSGTSAGGRGYIGFVQAEYEGTDVIADESQVVTCDDFTGPDSTDIHDRDLDGCGLTPAGTWRKRDDTANSGDDLGTDNALEAAIRKAGFQERVYDIPGLPTFPNAYHGARAVLNFPSYDTPGTPESCNLIWEDTFSGPSAADLDGRVHSGGSAGTGTYERLDPNSLPAKIDGSGGLIQDNASPPTTHGPGLYAVRGLTLPAKYRIEIECERTNDIAVGPGQQKTGNVGILKYVPSPFSPTGDDQCGGAAHLEYASMLNGSSVEVYGKFKGSWSAAGVIGSIILGSTADPPGSYATPYPDTVFLQMREDVTGRVTLYKGDSGGCDPMKAGGSVYNGQFSTPGSSSGDPGLVMDCGDTWRITAFRIYEYVPAVAGASFEYGYADLYLRVDETTGAAYLVTFEFDHFSYDYPIFTVYLYMRDSSGIFWLLTSRFVDNVDIAHDVDYVCEAWILQDPETGDDTLYASLNGVTQAIYDLTEVSTETHADPITEFPASGNPGLQVYDNDVGTQVDIIVKKYQVLIVAPPGTDPCTGDPGGPNPWPYPPPVILTSRKWVFKNQEWREVILDSTQLNQAQKNQGYRQLVDSSVGRPSTVFANQAWRDLYILEGNDPDPIDGRPPNYDPCQILPTLPPPSAVDPITGRWYGIFGTPVSVCGDLFTGTKFSLGGWTAGDLALCAAKSVYLLTSVSGRQQFLHNGFWDPVKWVDVMLVNYSGFAAMLAASPWHYAMNVIDDFESNRLWPTNLSITAKWASLASAIDEIRPYFPGVRLAIRRIATGVPFHLGVDAYCCQFESWRGISAYNFGFQEYSRALSYGAQVTLDLNYLHGGNGSSGIRFFNNTGLGQSAHNYLMSATEIVDYMTDILNGALDADATGAGIAGSGGYQYVPDELNLIPSNTAAYAAVHNLIAGLPALP